MGRQAGWEEGVDSLPGATEHMKNMAAPPLPAGLDRIAMLAALRARMARLDRGARQMELPAVPVAPALDDQLPDAGLARGALHEILVADEGAATGFAALMLARAGGPVLWIAPQPDLYPPGLVALGLSAASLVLVRAAGADALWAAEEALRCPAVAAVAVLVRALDLTTSRRLQLAAEKGGGLALALRPDAQVPEATAALTRWRTGSLPADQDRPCWRLELLKARNGRPAAWRAVLSGQQLHATPLMAGTPAAAQPLAQLPLTA